MSSLAARWRRLTEMTEWIKHDSTEPPVLAPAALVEVINNYGDDFGPACVNIFCWGHVSRYYSPTDLEGVPYCSADGLEEWARYVATDSGGEVLQLDTVPQDMPSGWLPIATWMAAPDTHRHPGDWQESLYRVWRDE